MDDLLGDIKEKLPDNCIYKIGLIASVYAGTNNFCHHLELSEKIRPIILETMYASEYAYYKIRRVRGIKQEFKSFSKIMENMRILLNVNLFNLLGNIRDDDQSYESYKNYKSHNLYSVDIFSKNKYRGRNLEYKGYFYHDPCYFHNRNNCGSFMNDDIENFKRLLNDILSMMTIIKTSFVITNLSKKSTYKVKFDRIEKKIMRRFQHNIIS